MQLIILKNVHNLAKSYLAKSYTEDRDEFLSKYFKGFSMEWDLGWRLRGWRFGAMKLKFVCGGTDTYGIHSDLGTPKPKIPKYLLWYDGTRTWMCCSAEQVGSQFLLACFAAGAPDSLVWEAGLSTSSFVRSNSLKKKKSFLSYCTHLPPQHSKGSSI